MTTLLPRSRYRNSNFLLLLLIKDVASLVDTLKDVLGVGRLGLKQIGIEATRRDKKWTITQLQSAKIVHNLPTLHGMKR
jgi:hypothetical protein